MFHYRITVRSKRGGREVRRTSVDHYRQYTARGHLGADVEAWTVSPGVTSVTVTKIKQSAYVKATRAGE